MPLNNYEFVEHWELPGVTPEQAWDIMADTRKLPQWWRGVYQWSEPVGDPTPRVGSQTRVRARGFLPYTLSFIIENTEVERGRVLEVKTVGDFVGIWRADLSRVGNGTRVNITWRVIVEKPLIRYLSPLLKPLFAWNHRWTTPRGQAGLLAYLSEQSAQPPGGQAMSSAV